ncbi:MAG: T9SS type A sorting domain-containing protein [Bacteroidetes bacterium]|nr:MAG: T9SS type A sorting domain-containing protein [Bacteroidota bacterium]
MRNEKKFILVCVSLCFLVMSLSSFVNGSLGDVNRDDPPHSLAYPNPFQKSIEVHFGQADELLIVDLLGEPLRHFDLPPHGTKVTLDLSSLRKGVYFYVLRKQKKVLETRRIVKEI